MEWEGINSHCSQMTWSSLEKIPKTVNKISPETIKISPGTIKISPRTILPIVKFQDTRLMYKS